MSKTKTLTNLFWGRITFETVIDLKLPRKLKKTTKTVMWAGEEFGYEPSPRRWNQKTAWRACHILNQQTAPIKIGNMLLVFYKDMYK